MRRPYSTAVRYIAVIIATLMAFTLFLQLSDWMGGNTLPYTCFMAFVWATLAARAKRADVPLIVNSICWSIAGSLLLVDFPGQTPAVATGQIVLVVGGTWFFGILAFRLLTGRSLLPSGEGPVASRVGARRPET